MTHTHQDVPILLNEKEVSQLIRKSVYWLQRARWAGNGIPYRKLGAHVLYDKKDVIDWLNRHSLQNSTSN